MKKIKSPLMILAIFIFVFATIGIVSASHGNTTINAPADDSTIAGSFRFNSSMDTMGQGGLNGTINVSWYAFSPNTAQTDWILVTGNFSLAASDLANGHANYTVHVNTTGLTLEDGLGYTFNVTYINASNGDILGQNITTATITVDNGVPPAPTSLTISGVQTTETPSFSATVTDVNTTGCSINFTGINPGSPGYDMTYSGSTCSISTITFPEQSYSYKIIAHDGTNATESELTTFNIVTAPGGGGGGGIGGTTSPTGTTGGNGLGGNGMAIIVIVTLVGLVWWIKKK